MVAIDPCAKLRMPEVLYVTTSPIPANAYTEPVATPTTMKGRRVLIAGGASLGVGQKLPKRLSNSWSHHRLSCSPSHRIEFLAIIFETSSSSYPTERRNSCVYSPRPGAGRTLADLEWLIRMNFST